MFMYALHIIVVMIIAIVIPFWIGMISVSDTATWQGISFLFVATILISGMVFRYRSHGRQAVVHGLSFEQYPLLALVSGFSFLTSTSTDELLSVSFGVVVLVLFWVVLSEGPEYGWGVWR